MSTRQIITGRPTVVILQFTILAWTLANSYVPCLGRGLNLHYDFDRSTAKLVTHSFFLSADQIF